MMRCTPLKGGPRQTVERWLRGGRHRSAGWLATEGWVTVELASGLLGRLPLAEGLGMSLSNGSWGPSVSLT